MYSIPNGLFLISLQITPSRQIYVLNTFFLFVFCICSLCLFNFTLWHWFRINFFSRCSFLIVFSLLVLLIWVYREGKALYLYFEWTDNNEKYCVKSYISVERWFRFYSYCYQAYGWWFFWKKKFTTYSPTKKREMNRKA